MSSRFALQKPYVLASLPRPIDHSNGRYVVGDVFGGAPGSKKRKRSELAVGIDGEGVNLYDISATRLITSYALPPQTSFTCPPCSLRTRLSKSKVERRTYVSTIGPQAQVTLFYESTDGSAATQTSTETRSLGHSKAPVAFLGTIRATRGSDVPTDAFDLLLLKEDGEVQCLDGDNLKEKWTSPASALGRDAAPVKDLKVEFACLTNAFAASQSILKGRQDVFTHFSQEISEEGFNPDILLTISKSKTTRNIHIVSLPRRTGTGATHSVESLLTSILPNGKGYDFQHDVSFSIQISTGTIQQHSGSFITTFDLTETIPKELTSIKVKGAKSSLRLSNTSIMVSTSNSISVYNPKYQSILASIKLDGAPALEPSKKQRNLAQETNGEATHTCTLVSYYPKLGTAVAIANNELVAVQIEGRSRASGLLIDSLGCSIRDQERPGQKNAEVQEIWLTTLETYLPGSIGTGEPPMREQVKPMISAASSGNTVLFDSLMAAKLGGDWADKPIVNGTSKKQTKHGPSKVREAPLDVDRRWIIFALKCIFAWTKEGENEYRLTIPFYPPNVFTWLLQTGNMTVANIESALRNEIRISALDNLPAGELVNALVELDGEMDLLLALISRNFLGAGELSSAIRVLMESLELFGDHAATKQQLITNGEDLELAHDDIEAQVEALEAEAEADLALAEHQLGPGSGVRGEALSLALSKLYTCPTDTIVFALQTTLTSQEIVSLIYLLRFELARGAWTSRYMDVDQTPEDEEEGIADNSIVLISSLLNNCIDSIGAGGWISGDARLVNGDPFEAEELIASLKLEVSAALEGIEEATYLKGLMSEMIRFGDAIQKGSDEHSSKKRKSMHTPVLLPSTDEDASILPFGLKADQKISLLRVGAGGEIHARSARDIGRLKSQKVGQYSLERIII